MILARLAPVLIVLATHTQAPWPDWWHRQALCIHRSEAVNYHEKRNPVNRGGWQFQYTTWASTIRAHPQLTRLSLPADPADATPYQQELVAWYRWIDSGRSWSDWLPYDHAYHCLS